MGEIENSAGSADKEMKIIEESWEFKVNALKQTWVGFLTELADRGTIGDLIDALTTISELLTNILKNKAAFTMIASLAGGAFLTKNNVGGLKNTSPLSYFALAA